MKYISEQTISSLKKVLVSLNDIETLFIEYKFQKGIESLKNLKQSFKEFSNSDDSDIINSLLLHISCLAHIYAFIYYWKEFSSQYFELLTGTLIIEAKTEDELKEIYNQLFKLYLENRKKNLSDELILIEDCHIEKMRHEVKERLPDNILILGSKTTPQIKINQKILNDLQKEGFIENAQKTPLKWLKNKQLLREFLTNKKIKGTFSVAEIERQTPTMFIDNGDKPMKLAKNKVVPNSDSDKLIKILATE